MLALKIPGIILFVYIGRATWRGMVMARRGIGWPRVERTTRPRVSLAALACPGLPAAALSTAF